MAMRILCFTSLVAFLLLGVASKRLHSDYTEQQLFKAQQADKLRAALVRECQLAYPLRDCDEQR